MNSPSPPCPKCAEQYAYEDRGLWNCPSCGHEWATAADQIGDDENGGAKIVRDANGVELKDGDTVTVVKDLKIKNSSTVVKVGTKVKNIKLVEGDHDIDCKIPGIGPMGLKSEFVKKISD
jgi:protein PhnA